VFKANVDAISQMWTEKDQRLPA